MLYTKFFTKENEQRKIVELLKSSLFIFTYRSCENISGTKESEMRDRAIVKLKNMVRISGQS